MNEEMIVAKFGGSSLADANQIRKVKEIVLSNPDRRCIVVSAPGKRHLNDQKITDLLIEWYRLRKLALSTDEVESVITFRYQEIINELGLEFDFGREMEKIKCDLSMGASQDYLESRGEYLCARIVAMSLQFEFVDAAEYVHFNAAGEFDNIPELFGESLRSRYVVMPGYYGSMPDGTIKTFQRGGSDISGACIAQAARATVYENWTDKSGMRVADPKVVKDPIKIHEITYRELRELTYSGAEIFQSEAMFPVQDAGIPINIRNTNDPEEIGTFVADPLPDDPLPDNKNAITGIAGRQNFTVVTLYKRGMNDEKGFSRRVLSILESNQVNYEHMPGSIDSVSLIIYDEELTGKLDTLKNEIMFQCKPDSIEIERKAIALIAVVGRGMVHQLGIAARIFDSLRDAKVNVKVINQGASEMNIIVGVSNHDYEKAIQAIYSEFVHE